LFLALPRHFDEGNKGLKWWKIPSFKFPDDYSLVLKSQNIVSLLSRMLVGLQLHTIGFQTHACLSVRLITDFLRICLNKLYELFANLYAIPRLLRPRCPELRRHRYSESRMQVPRF